jgi:outer membrane receptor protein involved in Fe transport
MHLPKLLSLSASAIALAGATVAAAQTPAPEVAEIVVTAQKREQGLQQVPIAVTALSADRLNAAGVRDIKDLAILTPGLLVASTSNPTFTTARLRGVGTVGDNPGLESSVGVVVDGVYRPRNGVAFTDLGELARIEVLKGPQGDVFGKNTSAGVINVTTQKPSFDFGATGEATVGNHGTYGGSVSVTGPIAGDKAAGRLYVAARKRDGFYSVRTGAGPRSETRDDDQDYWTGRGQLLLRPADNVEIRLIGDYSRRDENCCVGVQLVVGPTQGFLARLAPDGGVASSADPYARVAWSNRNTHARITDGGVSAEVEADLSEAVKLTSLTSWRQWRGRLGQDWDFTSADIAYRADDGRYANEFRTFSQELRLAGTAGKLDWLVGGFYARENLDRNDSFLYGTEYERYLSLILTGGASTTQVNTLTGLPAGSAYRLDRGLDDQYRQREHNLAVFTNNVFHVTDKLELTLGLRYTRERKSLTARFANTDGGAACAAAIARSAASQATLCLPWSNPAFNNLTQNQKLAENEWSGTAKAYYRFTPTVGGFVSFARGYKAGGFNLDRSQTGLTPDASTRFPGELVDDYEAGLRTEWFERRLILNLTAFYEQFDNFQLNTFLGTTFTVRSIPRVTARGADLDMIFRGPAGFSLQGGATFAETEYGQAVVPGLARLPGSRLSFAPRWSGSLAATWERPVADGLTGTVSLSGKYSSDYNTGSDLDPLKVQKGFVLLNARAGIAADNDAWSLEVWAQNLADKRYIQVAFGAPFQTGTTGAFLGAPRTFGATLRLKR